MVARFDEDDYPGEGVAVVSTGDVSYVLPKAALRLDRESQGLLGEISTIALEVMQLEARLAELTALGRQVGVSWSLLGAAQGLTGEALRRRSLDDS